MFIKWINSNMCNKGLQFKVGLNTDTLPFSTKGDCVRGGIYYCDFKYVMKWQSLGYTHLCTVKVPEDAQTVRLSDKYRSDKIIIIDPPVPFKDHKMWKDNEICKHVVEHNGYALQFAKEQTDEICKLAVKQDGFALKHINNQTDEICKLAVQQDGFALRFAKIQTNEICKLAIKQNAYAIRYVKLQTTEICKLAVKQNGLVLQYLKLQTNEICKLAIQQSKQELSDIISVRWDL